MTARVMDDVAAGGSREPPRAVAHYVLLALVLLVILATQLVSARGILLGDLPDVVHVADIPPRAGLATLDRYVSAYAYTVPDPALRPEVARVFAGAGRPVQTPPRLGYSIRQIVFLGLPFFAYREGGYVLYRAYPGYRQMAPLGADGLELLRRQAGEDLTAGWVFPFWRVGWGWLAVAAVAAFAWLEWRGQVRRREALGLI